MEPEICAVSDGFTIARHVQVCGASSSAAITGADRLHVDAAADVCPICLDADLPAECNRDESKQIKVCEVMSGYAKFNDTKFDDCNHWCPFAPVLVRPCPRALLFVFLPLPLPPPFPNDAT